MRKIYTIETLAEAASGDSPARLAVLGFPVSHSASPQLHQPALDAFGKDFSYIRLEVEPGDIDRAFRKMRKLNFIGCNVTVPHKFEAMECCTAVSEQARVLGAVNTVVFSENETRGFNTDGPGLRQAIQEAFGMKLGDTRIIIFGAGGGAGQAIATQCALEKPASLTLVNRSLDKIIALSHRLKAISPETEIHILDFDDTALIARCHDAQLLIQTTSMGLKENDPKVIPDACFLASHCAYDTIYKPPETPFLKSAKLSGCRTDNGLSLLIHQGAIAFQHWFPGTDPLPYMRTAMRK